MTDNFWVWSGVLGTLTLVALYLAFHFSKQRWPRVIAFTTGAAMVSVLIGEIDAVALILFGGVSLAVASTVKPRE